VNLTIYHIKVAKFSAHGTLSSGIIFNHMNAFILSLFDKKYL